MTQRRIDVLHVLAARGEGRRRQYLFYPHRKWTSPDSGRPVLALPTKKIATGRTASSLAAAALRRSFTAVLHEDLGLAVERPTWERRLPRAGLEMCSPTQGVPTTYTIWPVLLPVDPPQHDALRARLGGRWLTGREALRHPLLSPTARRVLERGDLPSFDPSTAGETGERKALPVDKWTARLAAAARAGDVNALGPLFEEMRPWLRACLRACPCTNPLFQVRDDVEDALQDAVVNALSHLHAFDPCLGSARTWLWTLTRNCAVTILRRRGRPIVSLFHEDGRPREEIAGDEGDPADLSEEREELVIARRRLEQALGLCGDKVRLAWELRHLHGKQYDEIAEVMGRPLGTIATWMHRVKTVAREVAAAEEEGPTRGQ